MMNMRMDRTRILIAIAIMIYAMIVFFGPVYRYGDDLRYLAIGKTMAETGDAAPLKESVAGTVFDGPPLFEYFLALLYALSGGSVAAWMLLSKLFVLAVSALCLLLVARLSDYTGLSEKGKMMAVALFAFYPPTLFTATSVMQDMLLALLTLLSFFALVSGRKSVPSFLKAGFLMGLMLVLKVTAPLMVAALLLSVILKFGLSRRTVLLCGLSLLVALLMWSPWVARNIAVSGNPIYHHSAEDVYQFYPGASDLEKPLYAYLSLWGIPAATSIVSRVPSLDNLAILLELAIAVFITPVLFFGLREMLKRERRLFAPFICLGLLFTLVYLSVFVSWTDPRHFIFAMPFFSVLAAGWAEKSWKRSAYVWLLIAILLSGAVFIEYTIHEVKAGFLGSMQSVLAGNPGKDLVACDIDTELRLASGLFYGRTVSIGGYPSCDVVREGSVGYCMSDGDLFLSRTSTSSSTCRSP